MSRKDLSPIFLLTIAFSLGIILADCLKLPLWLSAALILVSLASLLASWAKPFRLCWLLPYWLFLWLGFFLTSLVISSLADSRLVEIAREGKSTVLLGKVANQPKSDELKTSFHFRVETVESEGRQQEIDELTRVTIRDPGRLQIENGQRLKIQGRLILPRASINGSFDYCQYLYRQRIQTKVIVRPCQVKLLKRAADPFIPVVNTVRRGIIGGVYRYLPDSQGGLMLGILLGDTAGIAEEVQDDFRATGLTHILAVSGLNVGALVLICFFTARVFKLRLALSYSLAALVVVFYTLLTGGQPSVLRASIMALIGMAGFLLGRRRDLVSAISAAALILLIYDPFLLYDISFQLSFAATYAIIFVTPVLDNKLVIEPDWLKTAVSVTSAAQLGVAPILIYYFNQISLISLLANVLVVPVNAPVLALGIAGGLAGLVSTWLAYPVYGAANICLSYMITMARLLADVPGSSLMLEKPSLVLIVAYYLLLPLALAFWGRRFQWRLNLGALTIAFLLPLVTVVWGQVGRSVISDDLKVTFLDVGQGDASLIQTAEGETVLIDGGEDPSRLESLLAQNGVQRIDLLVLTHPHFDHVGGLAEIIANHPVGMVLDSGQPHTSAAYLKFLKTVDQQKIPYKLARRGQRFELKKIRLEVLHPPPEFIIGTASDLNNNSIVLKLIYGEMTFLFTGDIGQEGELSILSSSDTQQLKADVLKVPHHGSSSSGDSKFIQVVRPEVAVISVGQGNAYGHPARSTISKLKAAGAKVYRTDHNGSVTITSDGIEFQVKIRNKSD